MAPTTYCRCNLLYLLSFAIALVSIPFLVVAFIPLLFYRYFVTVLIWTLSKISNRFDGLSIVSPESSTYAVDEISSKPTCTLVISIEFGAGDPSNVTRRGIGKLQKLIDSGNYPELQSYLTTWMGFSFWKLDPDFNIDEHLHLIEHPLSQEQLDALKRDLLQRPFARNTPLWDFTRVIKASDYRTVLLFRIHHSVADGRSVINLTSQLRDNVEPWTHKSPTYVSRSRLQSIWFHLRILFWGPVDLVYSILKGQDVNAWKFRKYSGNVNMVESSKISLRYMKDIAKCRDVSVTSVLFAGVAGAVRNMMLKYNYDENVSLPDYITVICPFPLPGHPERLSNHMTMVPVKVPLGQPNPILRLKEIQEQLYKLKNSTLPFVFSIAIKLIGSLPRFLIKSQSKGGIGTAVLSNFPGPDGPIEICGNTISEIKVMSGIAHGMMGVNCGVMSYNGNLTMSLGIDEIIISSTEGATEFLELLLKEFCVLSKPTDAFELPNLRKVEYV